MTQENQSRLFLRTPFITMLINIAWVYLIFFICHFVFIGYNWDVFKGHLDSSLYPSMLLAAFKFDTAGIMYLSVPYIALMMFPLHFKEKKWYYVLCKTLLVVPVSAGVLANLADTVYYPYTGCRSTFQILAEFSNEETDQISTIFANAILDNWYLVLFFIAVVIFLIWRIKIPAVLKYHKAGSYYIIKVIMFCLSATLSVVGMRGGWSKDLRPITMSTAFQYVERQSDAAAVLNTPFCAIRTLDRKTMNVPRFYDEEELESIYTPVIMPDTTAIFKSKNVVVLILESFGAEYVGFENKGREGTYDCTPFLNSLMEKSLTFEYSQANGRKSIDAMPSILSSIPMLKDHFFLTPTMMSKDVSGLAEELGHKGYYSAFFHGASHNSMGFCSYSRVIGYQDYFDREQFEELGDYGGSKAFDGVWAIWDEEFLQYMCDRISTFKEPFVTTAFTASSHHPYNIPDRYKGVYTDEGNLPIYRCVKYSDHALELFFEKAKQQPWYDNTLFVLTADHTNLSEHDDYQSDLGQFRVPIIFFDPSSDSIAGRLPIVAQQSDILPSILGYLGYDRPFIGFGQNLFSTAPEDKWVANCQGDIYLFYKGDLMIRFDGREITSTFDFKKDPNLKNNIKGQYPEQEQSMLRQLKAIIQQYMEYMTEKNLVI